MPGPHAGARALAREPQDEATRREAMHAANPIYIPRNHRVEAALAAAIERDDYGPFEELLAVLAQPVRGAARIRRLRRAAARPTSAPTERSAAPDHRLPDRERPSSVMSESGPAARKHGF